MDQLTEPKLDSKSFSHHCAVIPLLSQFVIPISFQHHSNAISSSFQCRFSARDMRKVLRWNASKTEIVSFRCHLISERYGTMSGPRLTERRIDVGTTTNVGESDPNGRERGSNGPRRLVVRFFVPVIRTSFLVRRSFVREIEEELERPPNEGGWA